MLSMDGDARVWITCVVHWVDSARALMSAGRRPSARERFELPVVEQVICCKRTVANLPRGRPVTPRPAYQLSKQWTSKGVLEKPGIG